MVESSPMTNTHYPEIYGSVSFVLHERISGIRPFITHINMNGTNDCIAYINKLAAFGTNGQALISASAGRYANTNYVLDGIRKGAGWEPYLENFTSSGNVVASATNGLMAAGVSPNEIWFFDGLETLSANGSFNTLQHPTGFTNLAGYICWGYHSSLDATYATNGLVQWAGNSRWWIMQTTESGNGARGSAGDNFTKWFSANSFGGTNYSNTPVGAVTHVEEPRLPGVNDASRYFGLWAKGENLAISAWNSRNAIFFQAIGDPLVTR
jgi:hypothetical protein